MNRLQLQLLLLNTYIPKMTSRLPARWQASISNAFFLLKSWLLRCWWHSFLPYSWGGWLHLPIEFNSLSLLNLNYLPRGFLLFNWFLRTLRFLCHLRGCSLWLLSIWYLWSLGFKVCDAGHAFWLLIVILTELLSDRKRRLLFRE